MQPEVEELFSKSFTFIRPDTGWKLPSQRDLFKSPQWSIPIMQKLKDRLNSSKDKLNDFNLKDWHKHTREMNLSGVVLWNVRRNANPEILTQAWLKFYELLCRYPIIWPSDYKNENEPKQLVSFHLCEAPGAFVASLNHYLKLNYPFIEWNWMATTYNPHYEGNTLNTMINDDRFILHTYNHWSFGEDLTGNIMNLKNLKNLIPKTENLGDVLLVTADGSVDCQDTPDEQESLVAQLFYCEIVAALHILSPGGSFVIKMFTMFEQETICLIYLLNTVFGEVHVCKPATSKASNSEVYVVCLNYCGHYILKEWLSVLREYYGTKKPTTAMFSLFKIPEDFIEQIIQCCEKFCGHQEETIIRNICLYTTKQPMCMKRIKELRFSVAAEYVKRYNVQPITEDLQIVGSDVLSSMENIHIPTRKEDFSFNEKMQRSKMNIEEKSELILNDISKLDISWVYDDIDWLFMDSPTSKSSISIVKGAPVRTIFSSKFCCVRLLEIYNEVRGVFQKFTQSFNIVGSQLCEELNFRISKEFRIATDTVIINFKDLFWACQNNGINFEFEKKVFIETVVHLDNMWRDSDLIIEGLPLLTQFTVGLVFLVGHLFEGIGFVKPCGNSFAIIFRKYKSKTFFTTSVLREMRSELETLQPDYAILSVVSIFEAAVNNKDFYKTICCFNNVLLKEKLHLLNVL